MTNTCYCCGEQMMGNHVKVTDYTGNAAWLYVWQCACEEKDVQQETRIEAIEWLDHQKSPI